MTPKKINFENMMEKEKMLVDSISVSTLSSSVTLATLQLSASAFNSDKCTILSFGRELMGEGVENIVEKGEIHFLIVPRCFQMLYSSKS